MEAITSRTYARVLSSTFDFLLTIDPHLHRWPSLEAIYTIRSAGGSLSIPFWNWRGQGHWDLQLTSAAPLNLEVSTGVGEATLDLEQLQLSGLQIHSGVGATEVTLPGEYFFVGVQLPA